MTFVNVRVRKFVKSLLNSYKELYRANDDVGNEVFPDIFTPHPEVTDIPRFRNSAAQTGRVWAAEGMLSRDECTCWRPESRASRHHLVEHIAGLYFPLSG